MEDNLDRILDECIDRINRGESLERCLADYPRFAAQIEPLLQAMIQTQMTYRFVPSDDALRAGRQRLYAALEKRRKPPFWRQVFGRPAIWASVAGALVVLAIAYYGLRPVLFPQENPGGNIAQPPPTSLQPSPAFPAQYTPGSTTPQPPPQNTPGTTLEPGTQPPVQYIAQARADGNFVFLVSDEVNAIADFSHLYVTIEKVSLLQSGQSPRAMEFTPEVKEFDLTLLPGEKTQQLWRGDIPQGQYSRVSIEVSRVQGTLLNGETLEIKLPSNRLHLDLNDKSFALSPDYVTSFTYDLTVVNTGNAKEGGKYLLKPQINESGATQQAVLKSDKEKKEVLTPDTLTPSPVNNSRRD